jgi:hypothetical protein
MIMVHNTEVSCAQGHGGHKQRGLPIPQDIHEIIMGGVTLSLSAGSMLSSQREAWIQHDDDVDFTAVIEERRHKDVAEVTRSDSFH